MLTRRSGQRSPKTPIAGESMHLRVSIRPPRPQPEPPARRLVPHAGSFVAQQHAAEHRGGRGEERADEERRVVAARERVQLPSPEAVSVSVREAARLASTARPSAPPIMKAVLTTPEASPASLGLTSLIAASSTGLKAIPAPRPSRIMLGRTSTTKVPSTGARAKSRSPTAASDSPVASGIRKP